VQDQWDSAAFTGTYADVKEHAAGHAMYKKTKKRQWVTEKQDIATLFSNILTKMRTYKLREYVPPPGLAPPDVDEAWNQLLHSEARRSRAINAKIRE
jgi:hypothetical protein